MHYVSDFFVLPVIAIPVSKDNSYLQSPRKLNQWYMQVCNAHSHCLCLIFQPHNGFFYFDRFILCLQDLRVDLLFNIKNKHPMENLTILPIFERNKINQ